MSNNRNRVAIVGGARTPFAKAGTSLKNHSALSLGAHSVDGVLEKYSLDAALVEDLVYGIVVVDPSIPHIAREINFRSQLSNHVRSLTVTDNCISGTSAIISIHDAIVAGRTSVGIAGGVESVSNPPVLFNKKASRAFLDAGAAKTTGARIRSLLRLRPWNFKPWSYGVEEPSTGLSMGEQTELTVKEWQISRQDQDETAFRSHQNAVSGDPRWTVNIGNPSLGRY